MGNVYVYLTLVGKPQRKRYLGDRHIDVRISKRILKKQGIIVWFKVPCFGFTCTLSEILGADMNAGKTQISFLILKTGQRQAGDNTLPI
jgi:hypothetical protein